MSLIVGAVYFRPRSGINVYNLHVNVIDSLMCNNCNDTFLILGNIVFHTLNGVVLIVKLSLAY